jgi:hypothetical protein
MGEVETQSKDAGSITAMPEYRKFRALLRKVIKAPPLPQKWSAGVSPRAGNPNAPGRKARKINQEISK